MRDAEPLLIKIRDAARLEIAARIETQDLAGLHPTDGLTICGLLVASGIVQSSEPGTAREEVIDAWLKDLRTEIEHLQAILDRQRAADIEGCT